MCEGGKILLGVVVGGMGYVRGLSCGAQVRIRVLEDAIFNVVSHFSLSSGAVRTVGIGEMEAVRGKEASLNLSLSLRSSTI